MGSCFNKSTIKINNSGNFVNGPGNIIVINLYVTGNAIQNETTDDLEDLNKEVTKILKKMPSNFYAVQDQNQIKVVSKTRTIQGMNINKDLEGQRKLIEFCQEKILDEECYQHINCQKGICISTEEQIKNVNRTIPIVKDLHKWNHEKLKILIEQDDNHLEGDNQADRLILEANEYCKAENDRAQDFIYCQKRGRKGRYLKIAFQA